MGTLRTLCETYTGLSSAEIRKLEEVEAQLPLISDLANADVFLDCLIDENTALVVAQASPAAGISVYNKPVVGEYAYRCNEPAVFHAFQVGVVVCDLKAITQENRAVRQNVAPIRNEQNHIIGVLIREKDISADLQQQKKYEELARTREEQVPLVRTPDADREENALALREMHHRVKNSLQLVASILNLQARKASDPEVQHVLKENVSRVLSISGIHEILLNNTDSMQTVRSDTLLDKLRSNLQMLAPQDKAIRLTISGDCIDLTSDAATSVALVVTELVINAFQHAFDGRTDGCVEVSVCRGELFHTIAVSDNGTGFPEETPNRGSMGLRIVDATVRDKLKGKVHIASTPQGTKVSFDFTG